jgi:hypothetical protein
MFTTGLLYGMLLVQMEMKHRLVYFYYFIFHYNEGKYKSCVCVNENMDLRVVSCRETKQGSVQCIYRTNVPTVVFVVE